MRVRYFGMALALAAAGLAQNPPQGGPPPAPEAPPDLQRQMEQARQQIERQRQQLQEQMQQFQLQRQQLQQQMQQFQLQRQQAQQAGRGSAGSPLAQALGGPPGRWWDRPEAVERLGLTSDQQKRMDDVFQQSRLKLIDLNAAVQKEEFVMEPLLGAEQPDEAKIVAQIDKVAQARAELEKANARMLLGIRRVLTQEQWNKLKAAGNQPAQPRPNAQPGRGPAPPPPNPPGRQD